MSTQAGVVYVILKWPKDQTGFPRYTFATLSHVGELETPVERLRTCDSLEVAMYTTLRLNAEDDVGTRSEECRPDNR